MPSCYAHYRFGVHVLQTLPKPVQKQIEANRNLFDLGLQGPDFFFFYRLGKNTPVKKLGSKFHYQRGSEFFGRICRELPNPTDEELAYLYGLLGHYCLDSLSHPMIHRLSKGDSLIHNRMESEFERYLMDLDGISRPHFRDRGWFLPCKGDCCRVAARFYPGAAAEQIREAVWTMRLILGLLMVHPGAKWVLKRMGGANPGLLMESRPVPEFAEINRALELHFREAKARYPGYLAQLQEHIATGKPFGKEFEGIFG